MTAATIWTHDGKKGRAVMEYLLQSDACRVILADVKPGKKKIVYYKTGCIGLFDDIFKHYLQMPQGYECYCHCKNCT